MLDCAASLSPSRAHGEAGDTMKQIILANCRAGMVVSLLLGISVATCSSSSSDVVGTTPPSGSGNTTGSFKFDGSPPSSGGGGSTLTDGAVCGLQTKQASRGVTDVLLVLDRSGSMSESIAEDCCCSSACSSATRAGMCSNTSSCTERWPALTSAVTATIGQTVDIEWGLKFFSTPPQAGSDQRDTCAVNNGVEVGVAAGSAGSIQTAIAGVTPGANTPTARAITVATTYLQGVQDQNNRVILLATDGEPNCKGGSGSGSDVPGTVTAIGAAKAAGFNVYVIGIGPSVGNLDNFAQAGGTNHYYPATSPADLAKALAEISTQVTSCTFVMSEAPPVPEDVAVYIDGKLVPKDPANGWSFGANSQTIVFNGAACDSLKSGAASAVQVVFGCPGVPPPPIL
jgi:hypothetical protein